MKHIAFFAATFLLVASLLLEANTTNAEAGGGTTIDGLPRQDIASCTSGNQNCTWINFQGQWKWAIPFTGGQAVFGAHVIVNARVANGQLYGGTNLGRCYFIVATAPGYVVNGTVHPWVNEPQGNGVNTPCAYGPPPAQPPTVPVPLPTPMAGWQKFSGGNIVYGQLMVTSSGEVYANCWMITPASGFLYNGGFGIPANFNRCPGPAARYKLTPESIPHLQLVPPY